MKLENVDSRSHQLQWVDHKSYFFEDVFATWTLYVLFDILIEELLLMAGNDVPGFSGALMHVVY